MVDGFVKICEAVAGMVGLDKVSISKPWNSRVKTRSAAVEVSWTTKLPDSIRGGGSPGIDVGCRHPEADPNGGGAKGRLPKVVEKVGVGGS